LQADVVALQGTLTAAREVGKAAIAALRIDTVVPAKPDGSRGWRQLAMRFLLPERVKIGGHGLVQHSDRVAKNRMAASLAGGLLWRRKPSVISPACLVDGCGRHTGDLGARGMVEDLRHGKPRKIPAHFGAASGLDSRRGSGGLGADLPLVVRPTHYCPNRHVLRIGRCPARGSAAAAGFWNNSLRRSFRLFRR
jgi:hypothetical protein